MYLGFTFLALGSLYGNFIGQRLIMDSKLANKIFISFVVVFFLFGAVRMLTTTHYAGTDKENLWRSAMGQGQAK